MTHLNSSFSGLMKMRVALLILVFIGLPFYSYGKGKVKAWRSLSRPEKCWTLLHPFKAHTVYRCAERARFVTDSLEKAEVLTDGNGGQLDAFRHAYWNALMIVEGLSERTIRTIGKKHEKGNYLDFRKGNMEDGLRADSMACVMDLRNNETGIVIGKEFCASDKTISLIQLIMIQIWNGKLVILKKDAPGNYIDCSGNRIDLTLYGNVWYIPKCLVKSDEITVAH